MDALLPSAALGVQHRTIDAGVRSAMEADKAHADAARVALIDAIALLRAHLYAEEAVLFPLLVKSGLAMPVFVMKREHGQMWPLIQALGEGCAAGQPVETLQDTCRQLFQLLQMHNPKEEMIVYTAADRLAAQPDGASLANSLETARLPDGWTCAMASMGGPAAQGGS